MNFRGCPKYFAVALTCWSAVAFAQTAVVQNLGNWTPGSEIYPAAVSADGSVVAGDVWIDGATHAFLWKPDAGLADLGLANHSVRALSADGTVVVGVLYGENAYEERPFRRDAEGNVELLPALDEEGFAEAYDVSADGETVVGYAWTIYGARAVRWQDGAVVELKSYSSDPSANEGTAYAVSADGSVIVGQTDADYQYSHACIFRGPDEPALLLETIGGDFYALSEATDVSADGSIVVGWSGSYDTGDHACLWTSEDGVVDLGTVYGDAWSSSHAEAISADGSVIVGWSDHAYPSGGEAALWIDRQPRQLFEYLETEHGVTAEGWEFDWISDVSADGRTLVGHGAFEGEQAGFRITLSEHTNAPPTVTTPAPQTVECEGEQNLVTLAATVSDPDGSDLLTVTWSVAGAVIQTTDDVAPGSTSSFTYDYADGTTAVEVRVSDGQATAEAETSVTVDDTSVPIVIATSHVRTKVDKRRTYATVKLPPPNVVDVCDPAPKVTSDAPANGRFPIGTTRVVWTVTDDNGNFATAVQNVVVVNGKPTADAGKNVVKKTKRKSIKIRLNGRRSKDADGHRLSYRWSAKGTKIDDPTAANTFGKFKIGRTTVRLIVTDEAGARSTDTLVVNVKKVRKVRRGARAADEAVRTSYAKATAGAAAGREAIGMAYVCGALAGDDVDANGDASDEERLAYLTLRNLQARYAALAGRQSYESFLAEGDDDALAASLAAYSASRHAELDLRTGETTEVVVADVER